jgi:hypothetical protein
MIAAVQHPRREDGPPMTPSRGNVTCQDCYFRRTGLCALPGETPCPTFRAVSRGVLVPPRQPQLVARPLAAH